MGRLSIIGDQHDFAIQDENRLMGIDGHSILYFESGRVDTLKDIAGKGYLIYSCIRVPGGYLIVDERRQAYFFDPIAKAVMPLLLSHSCAGGLDSLDLL